MSAKENVDLMLGIFTAIERRDFERMLGLCHADVEFLCPPSLPYGEGGRGAWAQTWIPLQPREAERRMDPRILAATEDEVVVLWRQRRVSWARDPVDGPLFGLYQSLASKLARA